MLTLLLVFSLGGSVGFVAGCIWHARFARGAPAAEPARRQAVTFD